MTSAPSVVKSQSGPLLLVWWIIWASILAGLVMINLVLSRGAPAALPPGASPLLPLVGVVPLFLSIIIRWLVLPRLQVRRQAFILFVVGLALAEGCGILGTVFGGPYRDELFVLGLLGIAQFMPFFERGLREPKPQGFIPNN